MTNFLMGKTMAVNNKLAPALTRSIIEKRLDEIEAEVIENIGK